MSTKRRKPEIAAASEETTSCEDSRKKDRHKPSWVVRLPAYFKAAVEEFADSFGAEQGIEVDGTAVVKAAVREYLERKGVWRETARS